MSKTIGLIAEDDSDIEVIVEIISKYTARNSFSYKKFVGNGCGKLKQKCASWAKNLIEKGCDCVILFHDLDRNNIKNLRNTLASKLPPGEFPSALIVIPIEELEAWLLSDSEAIKKVFSLGVAPDVISDCERVPSPKEFLEKLVWKFGKKRYVNTLHNKKISMHTSLNNLRRCKSFEQFDKYAVEHF